MASRPRLFNIPASAPFLPTLIEALVHGQADSDFPHIGDPLALSSATLYLPTRRACRLARDVFVDVLGDRPALLPRIVPIGDIDEDDIIFAEAATGGLADEALNLPPAIGAFERKSLLANLVMAWASSPEMLSDPDVKLVANSPAAAFRLAADLARLMDDMITRGVSWDELNHLVPADMDRYWELTLKFLDIARKVWPGVLRSRGVIEPAERRDRLIAAEALRLQHTAPGLVIAAGSTGSMPSTARLLAGIARLPHGNVVLPGLDTDLDDTSWAMIGGSGDDPAAPGHPQFAMQNLLTQIGVTRSDVIELGTPRPYGRERLVSEALRPATATEHWQKTLDDAVFGAHRDSALAGLSLIEAGHADDEALAIAVALRETVDDGTPGSKGRTAALITPDRALARRVLAALQRWQVPVDDSGGDSLSDTQAGIFARLVAEAALEGCEPVTLLALLKHPLCRLGAHAFAQAPSIAILERAILRGPRPRAGSAGLTHALQTLRVNRDKLHPNDPRARLSDAELDRADILAAAFADALTPLETVKTGRTILAQIAACHRDAVTNLSRDHKNQAAAFAERDGETLSRLFEDIAGEHAGAIAMSRGDYAELFQTLAGDHMVRRPGDSGARVRIYGPLEARLQQADRVVLGGLAEGIWPPDARGDPWLSRPMRQQLGLDLPERRIGLSAHDFAQALGNRDIVLSRSAKIGGAPVVSSRFLQRLAALAGKDHWQEVTARGAHYLQWAATLDRPTAKPAPCPRPAPKPARALRPKRLSVTEIEHWLRDPYTIYAKHVLKLAPLDAVDLPPGPRDRGNVIHDAIGHFTQQFADTLPPDPYKELLTLGRAAFAPLDDYPEARAFWWPRFERIARWLGRWEQAHRADVAAIQSEIGGEIDVTSGFRLRARADRIERLKDGRYAVLDYKTGKPPTLSQVAAGLAPQLTLEAAILRQGGFEGIAAGASVAALTYLRISGGTTPGEVENLDFKASTPDQEADTALARLRGVVMRFDNADEPYLSFARPQWVGRTYGDYDHLARVKEWSATGGEEEFEWTSS